MSRRASVHRRRAVSARIALGLLLALLTAFAPASLHSAPSASSPVHHLARGFQNVDPAYSYSLGLRAMRLLRRLGRPAPARGDALVGLANDGAELRANGHVPTVTWVGHSTFLVQLDGVNILTDPHWGERSGPLDFVGPRRLVPPGLRFEDLPPINMVLISHDHYDHLDEATVKRIAREHAAATFFVPLGVKSLLGDMGVQRVVELDWWGTARLGDVTVVCTPAQHSSGRGLRDQNLRLWSSWAVLGPRKRFFFAGDTGYYAGLKQIGDRLGPFDLAAIPIGGYSAYAGRHPNHLNPEEAVQLFEDVRGRLLVPMHWGTFAMNQEPFHEPPDRLRSAAARHGLEKEIAVLSPGQTVHW